MTKDHIHTYRRVDIGKKEPSYIMQCSDAECKYFVSMASKLSCPRLRGKLALCNKCGESFELNRRALRMAEPVCNNCVKRKTSEIHKLADADAFFDRLEKNMGVKD